MAPNFFRLEKQLISWLWFWPSPELMTRKEFLKIGINTILMITAIGGELTFAMANANNLPIALNALGPVASKIQVLMKVLILFNYRMEVKECLSIFKRKMESELEEGQAKTMTRMMKIANIASKVLTVNITFTCGYYTILPLIQIIMGTVRGTDYEKTTPFKMLFPHPLDTNDSPTYEFKYLLSGYVCLTSLCGYVGVDGLYVGFCMHLSAHYKILSSKVAALGQLHQRHYQSEIAEDNLKFSEKENESIQRTVTEIIDSHVDLINLTKRISGIFGYIVFVHFFAAAIVIGMTSINLLLANWTAKMLYINYMAGSFLHAYLYAATGDYLHESTLEIMKSAYTFEWYKCNVKNQKSLLLIIRRSQFGTGIKAPFFVTDLTTFMSIVKTAGSYITLMNTLL